jgi:TPR repeat protein
MKIDLNEFTSPSIENLESLVDEDNHPKYLAYLNHLASEGNYDAANKLFEIYFWGDSSVEADRGKALELFRIFTEKNSSVEAAKVLAEHYDSYVTDEDCDEKAIYWLKFAEAQLDGAAAFKIGRAYYYGRLGLEENEDTAAEYFEKAIKYGFEGAYYLLSAVYFKSDSKQQQSRARQLLETGAKTGSADCQFELASRILSGEEQVRDAKIGLGWLTRAAEQGHSEALLKMGELHLAGTHVEKSAFEAFVHIDRAARGHNRMAQAQLSAMYLHGAGVEKSVTLGYAWLRIAERNRRGGSPVNMGFTGKVLAHHVLSDVQMKHAQAFVEEFVGSRSWAYRE